MIDADLAAAWAGVHEATPLGWYVGRPGYEERYNQWSMYALPTTAFSWVSKAYMDHW